MRPARVKEHHTRGPGARENNGCWGSSPYRKSRASDDKGAWETKKVRARAAGALSPRANESGGRARARARSLFSRRERERRAQQQRGRIALRDILLRPHVGRSHPGFCAMAAAGLHPEIWRDLFLCSVERGELDDCQEI